jgi:hypothetical protein
MGKPPESARKQLHRLKQKQRRLSSELARIDRAIDHLTPAGKRSPDKSTLNRWLDELADGLPALPQLPADFSRGDLYDDHD